MTPKPVVRVKVIKIEAKDRASRKSKIFKAVSKGKMPKSTTLDSRRVSLLLSDPPYGRSW